MILATLELVSAVQKADSFRVEKVVFLMLMLFDWFVMFYMTLVTFY